MSAKAKCLDALTRAGLSPRGLTREQAAAYVGISPTTFDKLIRDGKMPQPRQVDSRRIWDRVQIDDAFDKLPSTGPEKPEVDGLWEQARA